VTFEAATEKAKKIKLYGSGQELLADAFLRQHSRHGPYSLAELKSSLGKILTNCNIED
jgi:fructose 1,6-bisphosphatase